MKFKLKPFFLTSAVVLSTTILSTSCGAKEGATDPVLTKATLKNIAKGLKFNYLDKSKTFADKVDLADAKLKFRPETFDSDKYKYEIDKVSNDVRKGEVNLSIKVSLKDGSLTSDEVDVKVTGFKVLQFFFDEKQKKIIIAELKKPVARMVVNIQTDDLVIPNGNKAVNFADPKTYVKIGTYNKDFYNWVKEVTDEERKEIVGKVPKEAQDSLNFSTYIDIWNKVPGSLDKFFDSPFMKLFFENLAVDFVPRGVNFRDEITKIWKQDKTSIGTNTTSIFAPTGTEYIDFNKPSTYKLIFESPQTESSLDSFNPFKNIQSINNKDIKEIYDAFSKRVTDNFVLERDGNKTVAFVYYQPKKSDN